MIQMESKVQVADNTGARVAKMIGVIGTRSRHANVGDIITAHIRESIPTANVKKGDVVRAVVVVPHQALARVPVHGAVLGHPVHPATLAGAVLPVEWMNMEGRFRRLWAGSNGGERNVWRTRGQR
jgi:translation elongation factor EF-1alpha